MEEQFSAESDKEENAVEEEQMMEADLLKVSLQAYTCEVAPETMKIQGVLKQQLIHILIDYGSTNNYLDEKVAAKLNVKVDSTKRMEVVVANGDRLSSPGSCLNVSWTAQGHVLLADFHLLPLREFDMVLGIQCLRTLGAIVWNFDKLHMIFNINGKEVHLQGFK